MNNKGKIKRPLVFIASFIIIAVFCWAFSIVWNDYYNSDMLDPFWHNGNILMICIYAVIYVFFTKSFNGFRIGYLKWMGLLGSQALGIIATNIVLFIQISLIGRGRLSAVPMIALTACEIVFAGIWGFLFTKLFAKIYPPRRMIIVYGNVNAKDLVRKMSNRPDKYMICASISCNEDLEYIKEQILKYEAVIISDVPNKIRNKLIKFALDKSIRTYINPKLSDIIIRGAEDFHLFDTPLLLSRNDGLSLEQSMAKRFLDILFSFIALAITSPFLLITAIAIKCYDGGPVFYSQERLTTGGKVFKVHKFRSMIVNAEKDGVARLASQKDDRITPIGKIIRTIRFDELPQLINILKGDMSFVGPRPERPELTKKYCETMPEFSYRLKVKAGLTGYAQIMGKYNTTPYDKLKLDLMYIEHQSIWLDLKIILMTIKTCFVPDATEGVTGELPMETHRQETEEKVLNR
ncbi:MAG: sugar transferase [Oscillospiraceae bacterium]